MSKIPLPPAHPDYPKEKWKPVKKNKDRYLVSNYGRVYSILMKKCLKAADTKDGLAYVMRKYGTSRTALAHILVARHFVKNPYDNKERYCCVLRIDLDKSNCHESNLQWCSRSQIMVHYRKHGETSQPRAMLERQVRKAMKMRKDGMTIKAIAEHFDVATMVVSRIMSGKTYVDITDGKTTRPG